MATEQFSLSAVRDATRVVMRACGWLTLGHGAEDALWTSQVDAAGGAEIALDLSCVTQFDARGLGVVAALAGRSLRRGVRLSVIGASRIAQKLARLTGLDVAIPGNWNGWSGAPPGVPCSTGAAIVCATRGELAPRT